MPKTWFSPAKINLFLHVISKRDDGYHNLETIFQLLDYGDEISIESTQHGEIKRLIGNEEIPHEDDLLIKSARLLQQYTGCKKGCHISIVKNIPSGGGLGGGSSNAATVLIALNHLWQTHLSQKDLCDLGLRLGADVPIFIHGKSAWASGIGEVITPVSLPTHYFLVVSIGKHISTQEIFSHKALTMTAPIGKICDFSEISNPHNDCLDAAGELEGEILEALTHLKSTNHHLYEPRMTGSGSCVFAEFETKEQALVALNKLPNKWSGFVAKALNTSPLHNWAVAKR